MGQEPCECYLVLLSTLQKHLRTISRLEIRRRHSILCILQHLLNPRRASTVAVIIFLSCRYRLIEVANMKWNIDQRICTPLLLPLLLLLLRLRLHTRIQDQINCHTRREAHLAASRWEIPPSLDQGMSVLKTSSPLGQFHRLPPCTYAETDRVRSTREFTRRDISPPTVPWWLNSSGLAPSLSSSMGGIGSSLSGGRVGSSRLSQTRVLVPEPEADTIRDEAERRGARLGPFPFAELQP